LTHERHVQNALAALSREDSVGASLLVSGGSARARRAFLDALVVELRSKSPAWLSVRLAPRQEGQRLEDELPAAVEEALTLARAPASPPRGGVPSLVGALGAWLFRARAAGHTGIRLVIDDLDAWVNTRGVTRENRDFDALVEETRRRSIQVLASARPGAASGAPGVADALAARFEHAVSLGGARTVTRDPSALTSLLAGRSFSLAALQESIAAWVDLPPPGADADADDAVVVFTAPLAPPLVPDDTADETGLALPFFSTGEARAVVPKRISNAPPAPVDASRWTDSLRAAVDLAAALRRVEDSPVTDLATAERVFCESVASIPHAIERLRAAEDDLGVSTPRLVRASEAALARFQRDFKAVCESSEAPLRLEGLLERLATRAQEYGARDVACVLLPGLRWDLLAHLRERILTRIPGLREVESGAHWGLPARETVSHEALGEALGALRPKREHLGAHEVIRISVYAWELTHPKRTLESAAKAVEDSLPAALRSVLGGYAGHSVVLFASDVGVAEPSGAVGGGEARALGGDCPFAVVLPWALYTYGLRGLA
jgi:hypothetical protein